MKRALLLMLGLFATDARAYCVSTPVQRLETYELEWFLNYAVIQRVDKVWGACAVIRRIRFEPLGAETTEVCLKDEIAQAYAGQLAPAATSPQGVASALEGLKNVIEATEPGTAAVRAELEKRLLRALGRNPTLKVYSGKVKNDGTQIGAVAVVDHPNRQALIIASGPCP